MYDNKKLRFLDKILKKYIEVIEIDMRQEPKEDFIQKTDRSSITEGKSVAVKRQSDGLQIIN